MKKQYIPPTLEVFEYTVERGYAASEYIDPNILILDVSDSLEDVREGNEYNLFNEDRWC